MTDTKQPTKRILGDLRIFQAVVNDLKMKHELVELADGTHRYVYTYEGADPYEMEDSEFPLTVKLIHQYGDTREVEGRIDGVKEYHARLNSIDPLQPLPGSPRAYAEKIAAGYLAELEAELKKTKEQR